MKSKNRIEMCSKRDPALKVENKDGKEEDGNGKTTKSLLILCISDFWHGRMMKIKWSLI